ncbi:flagellar motor protein MotB [Paenibacillus sp. 1001270B_150601_E10]|uniref:flagellar motor protein MotB n=1 Tax=Paenibacillus sp. 1001270B_150601_E10 TaxID=2787079 RepID=UPI00189E8EE2|nr:flagellar motor protein MotB [Paenibacillus sp. 1001270B_150601_E10]
MSKKRKEHHEEHVDESWLIPYADLLTLLLALFIVLYAMSSVDAQKFKAMSDAFQTVFQTQSSGGGSGILEHPSLEPTSGDEAKQAEKEFEHDTAADQKKDRYALQAEKEQEQLEELQGKLNEYIAQNGLSDQLNTKLNHSELMLTINDSALFASGSATLKNESKKLAYTIGDMIKAYPGYQIVIKGHTDNVPIKNSGFESNWDLSSARALNFMKIVLKQSGLDPKQFQAVGMGEYHPIASNDSEKGKAENRRVEVSIIRKYTSNKATEVNAAP